MDDVLAMLKDFVLAGVVFLLTDRNRVYLENKVANLEARLNQVTDMLINNRADSGTIQNAIRAMQQDQLSHLAAVDLTEVKNADDVRSFIQGRTNQTDLNS